MERAKPKFGPVLIVEDRQEFWRPLRAELGTSGLFDQVAIAQNLVEAELWFEALECPAAVLMDACLSGEKPDTLDLTRKMREAYGNLIIIAMSRDTSFRRQQLQAGCSHESSKENAARYLINLMQEPA